jgi:hypothetical protein
MYRDANHLIDVLRAKSDIEATKTLTNFFVDARFALPHQQFETQYVDGPDDGGIDFCHIEDATFFVVQSKFSGKPRRTDENLVFHELDKLINTLTGQNPNKHAEDFVNAFRRNVTSEGILEMIWLTTNIMEQKLVESAQTKLDEIIKKRNWKLTVEFVAFDYYGLQRLVDDVNYGNIPYTGRQILPTTRGVIENPGHNTGVRSIVTSVKLTDILKWFKTAKDVERFLKRNIREYLGDKKINSNIQKSYNSVPDWFWYKHNGIIMFADSVSKSADGSTIILRNPQVVNGGQTLSALFTIYDRAGREESTAEVIVRVYRFPYENVEIYEKGISIIEALNSQNYIQPSDLHSTDARQVRLQDLIEKHITCFTYARKRGVNVKSGRYGITMRNLALYYHICKKAAPHEGVIGQLEKIFDDKQKYDDTFPEDQIFNDLSLNHIVIAYITLWLIADTLDKFTKDLPRKYEREISQYTWWFVMSDVYQKINEWKKNWFDLRSWRDWRDFIDSEEFKDALWNYARTAFRIATDMVPTKKEFRKFFKSKDATTRYKNQMPSVRRFAACMNNAFCTFKKRS